MYLTSGLDVLLRKKEADNGAANATSIDEAARLARADITDTLSRDTVTSERVLLSYDQLEKQYGAETATKILVEAGRVFDDDHLWDTTEMIINQREVETAEHLNGAEATLNKLEVNIDPDKDPPASSTGTGRSQK